MDIPVSNKNPIAILTITRAYGVNWLNTNKNLAFVNLTSGVFIDKEGQRYHIVMSFKDAAGLDFSDVIILPDYQELEQYVRSRIR